MSGSRLGPQTQVVLVQTSGVRATLDAADAAAAGWRRRRRTPRVVAHLVAVATAESDAIEQSLHEPRSRQIVLGDAVAVADVAKSFGFAPRHLPLVARFAGRLGFGGRVGQRFGPVAEPSPAATAFAGPIARRPVPAIAGVRVDVAGETHVVEYGQYRDVQADRALVFVVASVGQGIREHVPIATETAGATSMRSTGHDARGSYGRADVVVVAPGGGGVRVVGVETRQFVASSHVG